MRDSGINLTEDIREKSAEALNASLANTLYSVLASKFAHWNVKGTGFYPAHKLFDDVYQFYSESADILGERITALGGTAEGLIGEVSANSTIVYMATDTDLVATHMHAMAQMLGQVANGYRHGAAITEEDIATQDVFIQLARDADKLLYFLEADLRKA